MRFGSLPVVRAEGAILAHSIKLDGRRLGKGRVLSAADIEVLSAAGLDEVVVAELAANDVAEDEAAHVLASAIAGAGVRVARPFTGRCNLIAASAGLLRLNEQALDDINHVDEALTIATLPQNSRVDRRQMLATVKIIPFSVRRESLEAACAHAERERLIDIVAFSGRQVALIQTCLPGTPERVLDKTLGVLRARIEGLNGELCEERRCAHTGTAVTQALRAVLEHGAQLVLIVGASAIVDRRDVIPAGIVAGGGEIVHFGMPVDPGNLLLLARHVTVPVLGLPGCARSPKWNGLDQVLERLMADLEVTSSHLMSMGVGGLLKEFAGRPQSRERASATPVARAPRVAALVLAAGQSRRMGRMNKLLASIEGTPMVARVVDAALGSDCDAVYVVTGHQRERVEAALSGRSVRFVHNPDYAAGLSTSLASGVAALGAHFDAVLVCLGDMPRVKATEIDSLLAAFDPLEGRSICVPTYQGKRGNPVLWAGVYAAELQALKGDVGARHLIGEYAEHVCEVAIDSASVLIDVDSPDVLRRLGSEP